MKGVESSGSRIVAVAFALAAVVDGRGQLQELVAEHLHHVEAQVRALAEEFEGLRAFDEGDFRGFENFGGEQMRSAADDGRQAEDIAWTDGPDRHAGSPVVGER